MAGQQDAQMLGAIGEKGMFTQVSPIDLPPEFATLAVNCFANEAGRPTARKSAKIVTTVRNSVGASDQVRRMYRHNKVDGTTELISSTTGYVSRGTGTLTQILTNASTGNYQFASLNGKLFGVCESETMVWWNETTWVSTNMGTPVNPTALHSAFGRLWAVKDATLYWSVLLDGTDFTGAGSGSLDLNKIHTQFRDTAVAVTSFNGMIVVLCRQSLYILDLPLDKNPGSAATPLYLKDFIPNVGCYSRDSVVSTGDDVLFMSDDGLRSLSRSMQESGGPAPLTDMSASNKDYVINNIIAGNAGTEITAAWHPKKSWYMLFCATTLNIYLFDLGRHMGDQGKAPRMFVWTMGASKVQFHGAYSDDRKMYFAGLGGLYTMETYESGDAYTMSITSGWLSFGGAERLDIYKRVMVNITGGGGQTATLKWSVDFNNNSERSYQFELSSDQVVYEFNVAEYNLAEYTSGVSMAEVYMNISGTGKVIQISLEIPINGTAVTLNNVIAFYKQGRVR